MKQAKSFCISKRQVWEACKQVMANKGAAGVDRQTIEVFEIELENNLYKLWNRMSSGSYFPTAVMRVEIPKGDGRMRPLGIPTVTDRIAQMVVKQLIEPELEEHFHPDSYGYRPYKSARDALGSARKRCWKRDWVLDLDIKGFFDNIDHGLMMRAVRKHVKEKWALLYKNKAQAEQLKHELEARMKEVGLELHPEKTKIVYCKDDDRRGNYPEISFDFLGYTFRPRRSKNRWGKYFINFTPAISNKAARAIRRRSRDWNWPLRSDKQLEDLALMFNPIIQGWINYYGRYYKSALYPTLQCLERRLIMWATRKYKRLRNHRRRAAQWLNRIARKQPYLFAHWRLLYATAGL